MKNKNQIQEQINFLLWQVERRRTQWMNMGQNDPDAKTVYSLWQEYQARARELQWVLSGQVGNQ